MSVDLSQCVLSVGIESVKRYMQALSIVISTIATLPRFSYLFAKAPLHGPTSANLTLLKDVFKRCDFTRRQHRLPSESVHVSAHGRPRDTMYIFSTSSSNGITAH